MALDRIAFDVGTRTRELSQQGNLFYVEYIVVEANTRDATVTPTLTLEDTDVTLATFSTAVRDHAQILVNRLGPVSALEFTPVSSIQWFGIEFFVRPVQLGIRMLNQGANVQMPGRSVNAATGVRFEVNPFSLPESARFVSPIYRRLYVDIVTGAETVSPILEFDDGTTQTLGSITHSTRAIAEFALCTTKRVKAVRLDGNFASSAVILYDLEADVNVPNARTRAVG